MEEAFPITKQQKRIVELVAQDFTNKEIAEKLGVAEKTVKVHIRALCRRMNVNTRLGVSIGSLQLEIINLADITLKPRKKYRRHV